MGSGGLYLERKTNWIVEPFFKGVTSFFYPNAHILHLKLFSGSFGQNFHEFFITICTTENNVHNLGFYMYLSSRKMNWGIRFSIVN